jgi:hypothetical protein
MAWRRVSLTSSVVLRSSIVRRSMEVDGKMGHGFRIYFLWVPELSWRTRSAGVFRRLCYLFWLHRATIYLRPAACTPRSLSLAGP